MVWSSVVLAEVKSIFCRRKNQVVIAALAKMANFTQKSRIPRTGVSMSYVRFRVVRPGVFVRSSQQHLSNYKYPYKFTWTKRNRGTLVHEDLTVAMVMLERSKQGRETFDEVLIRVVLGISSDCSSSLWCFLLGMFNWFRSRFYAHYAVYRAIR